MGKPRVPGAPGIRSCRRLQVAALLAALSAILLLASIVPGAMPLTARAQDIPQTLPPVELDALDPARWSMSELFVAPGQTIRITNRGVQRHTFTVREWGIDVELPTLETIEVVVPTEVSPGDVFAFYCSEPGHRALGQEGTITIVSVEDALAAATPQGESGTGERIVLETSDDFNWSIEAFEAAPGQFIEIRNPGVIEHHFAVDEWNINETISPGEVVLVQVPEDAEVGRQYAYYCSVPGHRAGGMEGTITIAPGGGTEGRGDSGSTTQRDAPDFERFLPDAPSLGEGWSLVRTGDARAVVLNFDSVSSRVFPGTGRGATYVGPFGSRATILVLPFSPYGVPGNQVDDAIVNVQLLLMTEWEADLREADVLNQIAPPTGCDEANRASGVTRVYTLPAGSTVCQLRSAGIAIFVTIEGEFGTWSGVEAADQLIVRLLEGT